MNKLSVPVGGVTYTNHKHTTVHCKLRLFHSGKTHPIKMLFKGTFKIVLCVYLKVMKIRRKHCSLINIVAC